MNQRLIRFWKVWKAFGERMSHYFGILLFALMYLFLFAPMAIIFKVMGKHFLPRFKGDETTYFLPKEKIEHTLEFMKKQG